MSMYFLKVFSGLCKTDSGIEKISDNVNSCLAHYIMCHCRSVLSVMIHYPRHNNNTTSNMFYELMSPTVSASIM